MLLIGLTGSIGMGKSATATLFAEAGAPVHDSDAAVHAIYSGSEANLIEEAFPGVTRGGIVDRSLLGARVIGDAVAMARLEAIVHPLVGAARARFVQAARAAGHRIAVLDIPLLFEIGGDSDVDVVVVVTAPHALQKARVLARPGMTERKFDEILVRQVPDAEKRARAHFLIETDRGAMDARRQVRDVLRALAAADPGMNGRAK